MKYDFMKQVKPLKYAYVTPEFACRMMESIPFQNHGWIGVDLDGTLVKHDAATFDPMKLGEPIPRMIERVKLMIEHGHNVRIFTARVSGPSGPERDAIAAAVMNWCIDMFGQPLLVTCIKDYKCLQIWDDRAMAVEHNTGFLNNRQRDII